MNRLHVYIDNELAKHLNALPWGFKKRFVEALLHGFFESYRKDQHASIIALIVSGSAKIRVTVEEEKEVKDGE